MPWQSTKTYGHEVGISCAFRQWRATHSHCQYLHGYALSFKFVFEATTLDDKNWVADFGDFKQLKQLLVNLFDHKTVVALDDPELAWFKESELKGLLQLTVLPGVGCEKFAEYAFHEAKSLISTQYKGRVRIVSCEVAEHGANSAIYMGQ
jgi:6-pyruvoyltetrahydropterin/6-carboxytetrahydropterin synthase